MEELFNHINKDFMKEVGKRIRQKRKALKLTLADMRDKYGFSTGELSMIENGTRTPNIVLFYKLCISLSCSADELLKGIQSEEISLIDDYRSLSDEEKEEIKMLIKYKKSKKSS